MDYLILINKEIPKKMETLLGSMGRVVKAGREPIPRLLEEEMEKRDYDVIISVGGDTTHSRCAEVAVSKGLYLAPVPFGSGNDFAKALGIKDPYRYLKKLRRREGEKKAVDILEFRVGGKNYRAIVGIHLFLAGTAGDVERTPWIYLTRLVKARVYKIKGVWDFLFGRKDWPATVYCEGSKLVEASFYFGHIANTPTTGGGGIFVPGANVDDGKANVYLIARRPSENVYLALLRHLPRLKEGVQEPEVAYNNKCGTFKLVAPEAFPVGYDGEYIGNYRKLEGRVAEKSLKVIA